MRRDPFARMNQAFDRFSKSFDDISKSMDKTMAHVSIITNEAMKGAQQILAEAKAILKDADAQARALRALRDEFIGKAGLMVEFTVFNPTSWESFKQFFGLWKSKRIGMIIEAPTKNSFECKIEEPDGVVRIGHVLHLTIINPLDAHARGV